MYGEFMKLSLHRTFMAAKMAVLLLSPLSKTWDN